MLGQILTWILIEIVKYISTMLTPLLFSHPSHHSFPSLHPSFFSSFPFSLSSSLSFFRLFLSLPLSGSNHQPQPVFIARITEGGVAHRYSGGVAHKCSGLMSISVPYLCQNISRSVCYIQTHQMLYT